MQDRDKDLHWPYGPASRRLAGMEQEGGGQHLQLRCKKRQVVVSTSFGVQKNLSISPLGHS